MNSYLNVYTVNEDNYFGVKSLLHSFPIFCLPSIFNVSTRVHTRGQEFPKVKVTISYLTLDYKNRNSRFNLWIFRKKTTSWRGMRGVGVYVHIFLTSALVGGECSASRPGRFTPRERATDTNWIEGRVSPPSVIFFKVSFGLLLDSEDGAVRSIETSYIRFLTIVQCDW
jgi:hypothetical protein